MKPFIKKYKNDDTWKNIKAHNTNWRQITDHPYRALIIRDFMSGKNAQLSKINPQPDIKIYLYAHDLQKAIVNY